MLARRAIPQCLRCLERLPRSESSRCVVAQALHRQLTAEAAADVSIPPPSMNGEGIAHPDKVKKIVEDISIPPPSMNGEGIAHPDKIKKIVEDISKLTLLETSQLNELLKTTLNIPDAPIMTMSAPAQKAVEEEAPKEEQTSFSINLVKFAADSKIKLIKEVKAQIEGMNLVQAKKFVESLPQEVKNNVNKEDTKKLADALEAAGGTVDIV